jgi:hypothetical protein
MGGGNSIAVLAVAFALVVTASKPNNGIVWPMLKVVHAVSADGAALSWWSASDGKEKYSLLFVLILLLSMYVQLG